MSSRIEKLEADDVSKLDDDFIKASENNLNAIVFKSLSFSCEQSTASFFPKVSQNLSLKLMCKDSTLKLYRSRNSASLISALDLKSKESFACVASIVNLKMLFKLEF